MYFQTATTRGTDRRLVIAGYAATHLVLARLLTGLTLAALASAAALAALAVRTGIHDPVPVIGGTMMFAIIYVAVGAAVGAVARNPVNGTVIVLFVWILDADAVTPNKLITLFLNEGGHGLARTFPMPDVHGATMAPIAIGSLSALIVLFVLLDSRDGDRRAAFAGMKTNALLGARLGVLALTALAATAVSLTTTALVFHPTNWPLYIAANILIALTYGLIGALLPPIFGRVGGVFIAFLLPFLDLGIV